MDFILPPRRSSRRIVESLEDDSMNLSERWQRHVVLALVLVAIMVAPVARLGRVAGAQEATPTARKGRLLLARPWGLPFRGRRPGTCS